MVTFGLHLTGQKLWENDQKMAKMAFFWFSWYCMWPKRGIVTTQWLIYQITTNIGWLDAKGWLDCTRPSSHTTFEAKSENLSDFGARRPFLGKLKSNLEHPVSISFISMQNNINMVKMAVENHISITFHFKLFNFWCFWQEIKVEFGASSGYKL